MNEITKIHLGRQPFTIAIDAHKALDAYLQAIKRRVGDNSKDVVEEVELRMAELLAERKIGPDKVILLKDIDHLKEQLGSPKDFADGENDESESESEKTETSHKDKRLFRDTEHGMIAGVAAGLANYMGIDALFVRLGFILITLAGGWGIVLYIIMWLIVPEAKTSSAKLQMKGKAVTIDNLKQVVDRVDVPGAARRAGDTAGRMIEAFAKVLLTLLGVGVSLAAVGMLFGVMTASIYMLFNDGGLFEEAIFPIGGSEVLLLVTGMVAAGIVALLLLLIGVAMIRRKWQLPGWGVASLLGLLFVCLSVGGAMTADIAPKVTDRYRASQHVVTIPTQEFSKLHVIGKSEINYTYRNSPNHGVEIRYRGVGDATKLKTELHDQTLTFDASQFADSRQCQNLCLFHDSRIDVVIRGSGLKELITEGGGFQFSLFDAKDQLLRVKAGGVPVELRNESAAKVKLEKAADGFWNVAVTGQRSGGVPQYTSIFHDSASASGQEVELKINEPCTLPQGGGISIGMFQTLTVNGKTFTTPKEYATQYNERQASVYNCVGTQGTGPYIYPPEVPPYDGPVNGSW